MEAPKMLSGEELVSRGVTTIFATLPEIGVKENTPNGSWLEEKQTQAALETRKKLIDVERIEKFGSLSQAEWKDDLKLAEVTKQTGGHWQYFGHNVGKKLYIRSEEALFLMEINSLQLKHNGVTVSLQKAYSLLLDDKFTIYQYKVYASLSRLGYKVYRHKGIKESVSLDHTENKVNIIKIELVSNDNFTSSSSDAVVNENNVETNKVEEPANNTLDVEDNVVKGEGYNCQNEVTIDINNEGNEVSSTITDESLDDPKGNNAQYSIIFQNNNSGEQNTDEKDPVEHMEVDPESDTVNATNDTAVNDEVSNIEIKIQKLQSRQFKPVNDIHKGFEKVPEMANKGYVYVNIPEDYYIPKNIFVNKTTYKLNLEMVKGNKHKLSSDEAAYSSSDNDDPSIRRSIRNTPRDGPPQNYLPQIRNMASYYAQIRLPRLAQHFQPFMFWRPRPHFNLMHFNSFYSRPFIPHQFHSRFPFNVRPNPFLIPFGNVNMTQADDDNDNPIRLLQKRSKKSKKHHYRSIKMLTARIKALISSGQIANGQTQVHAIQSLQQLLYSYNAKYKTNLRLNSRFEITEEPNILQTIELDDEDDDENEEIQSKRPKLGNDTFSDNLNKLRELALKLKNLGDKGMATSRHRRAFSNALKIFNTSHNADVYLNDHYEIIDRRHITLESGSDAEHVDTEHKNKEDRKDRKMRKRKLRNPFNILKRLSEQQNSDNASVAGTSKQDLAMNKNVDTKVNINTKPIIYTNWLPKVDAFGRAELCTKNTCTLKTMGRCDDGFVFDFMKNQSVTYNSWIDAKIASLKYANEVHKQYLNHQNETDTSTAEEGGLRPIIRPEDCTSMPTILDKLRIIKSNQVIKAESNIKIHFDVYHRDVPNFRKSNPPKPHFRVVCFDDSSTLPPGEEMASLNAKYDDHIDIVCAIVGVGFISYLQINPTDIPVYIPMSGRE